MKAIFFVMTFAFCFLSCTKTVPTSSPNFNFTRDIQTPPAAQCADPLAVTDSHAPTNDWDKAWWLGKVTKILIPKVKLSPTETAELMKLDRVAVIDRFMQRPEFLDAVLDFNLFYLGFKQDQLRDPAGAYNFRVYDFPSAIESALSFSEHSPSAGNYFSLFNLYEIYYGAPFQNFTRPDEKPLTDVEWKEKRTNLKTEILKTFQTFIDDAANAAPFDEVQFCKDFRADNIENKFFVDYGIPTSIAFFEQVNSNGFGQVNVYCQQPKDKITQAGMVEKLKSTRDYVQSFLNVAESFDPLTYKPKFLTELKKFQVPGGDQNTQFGFTSRLALPNSSTNYNRKRAAYVLKNYFCDDLTPIQVETPIEHTSGQHGSDTSCFACHYKLDPMAGFFKNYGVFFIDFSTRNPDTLKANKEIVFDDNANVKLGEYVKAWAAPEGSQRTWNIGYVRSTNHEEMNEYGENLEDLFKIIKTAPEVKRCLTKRMFEYALSAQQTVDSGFLDYVSGHFTQTSNCQNSSLAFKNLVKEVLLSSSFMTRDPVADECYDFPPGYNAKNSPPCKINAVLARNCTECHSPSSDESDLDLTQWVKQSDGPMDFIHLDESGKQHTQKETLEMIQDRLQSTNLKKRMPKNHYMNPIDRETLFNWTVGTLQDSQNKGFRK